MLTIILSDSIVYKSIIYYQQCICLSLKKLPCNTKLVVVPWKKKNTSLFYCPLQVENVQRTHFLCTILSVENSSIFVMYSMFHVLLLYIFGHVPLLVSDQRFSQKLRIGELCFGCQVEHLHFARSKHASTLLPCSILQWENFNV